MFRRPFLLLTLLACSCATTTVLPPDERQDDPDAAAHYRALKQSGSDDPVRSLASAREAMRRMAEYSTLADAWRQPLPGQRSALANAGDAVMDQWQFLGPGNIGGRTRVLIIDPLEPRTMYTAGVSGGIWKTYDGGLKWQPIGDDLANIAVNSLVMDPTDSRVLYAGTGEGYFREVIRGTALPLRGDGIFVTRDAGETWRQLPATISADFHYVNDLVVSPANPTRIYAATRTGVWRSDDSGTTWSRILPVTVMGGCLDLAWRAGTNGDYLFASCGTFEQATVWRAKNAEGGEAWESVLSVPNMGRTSLAIAPSDPTVIYALSATNAAGPTGQGLLALHRSTSSGDAGSWQARATPATGVIEAQLLSNLFSATNALCRNSPGGSTTMGWYCNTIAVDPVDADRVWVGGVDLFRSDDGGASFGIASYWWANPAVHPAFVHADQHAIVFHPAYDGSLVRTMFVTNDGGVFRTDDATGEVAFGTFAACDSRSSKMRFQSLNNSYGVTQFYHGAVSPDGTRFVAGAQDNGTLLGEAAYGPEQWRHILGGDGAYVAFDPLAPRTVYAESQWANMARSDDEGRTFKRIVSGLPGSATAEFLFVTPFVVDGNESKRLWLGGRTLWVTTSRGNQWTRASTFFPGMVSAIAVQPGNSDRVVAGLATGQIARSEQATTSTASTAWTLVKPRDGFVSSIAFDPHDTGTVYATYAGFGGKHVWMSKDSGATWTSRDGNLPDIPVHSLAVDPTRPQRLYLGTDLGVFVTLDGGQTWAVENTGFANAVTETVVIAQGINGPAVYAFTHGRGAWRAELVIPGPKRRGVRH